jgi:hypothetical protein
MKIDATGRRSAFSTVTRTGIMSLSLLLTMALAACTTVEGTNALVDPATFEREVMSETLRGVGMLDREQKPEVEERRGNLALPKQTAVLPPPTTTRAVAQLPADSDSVQIDTTNLSEADLQRLRNARVVDLRTLSGRPLTETETKQMTARMNASNMGSLGQTKRPLYLPPDEYFTTVGGTDLVCSTAQGDLVKIDDKRCPDRIRKALGAARNTGGANTNGLLFDAPAKSD